MHQRERVSPSLSSPTSPAVVPFASTTAMKRMAAWEIATATTVLIGRHSPKQTPHRKFVVHASR